MQSRLFANFAQKSIFSWGWEFPPQDGSRPADPYALAVRFHPLAVQRAELYGQLRVAGTEVANLEAQADDQRDPVAYQDAVALRDSLKGEIQGVEAALAEVAKEAAHPPQPLPDWDVTEDPGEEGTWRARSIEPGGLNLTVFATPEHKDVDGAPIRERVKGRIGKRRTINSRGDSTFVLLGELDGVRCFVIGNGPGAEIVLTRTDVYFS